jgi:hypothetical protein
VLSQNCTLDQSQKIYLSYADRCEMRNETRSNLLILFCSPDRCSRIFHFWQNLSFWRWAQNPEIIRRKETCKSSAESQRFCAKEPTNYFYIVPRTVWMTRMITDVTVLRENKRTIRYCVNENRHVIWNILDRQLFYYTLRY